MTLFLLDLWAKSSASGYSCFIFINFCHLTYISTNQIQNPLLFLSATLQFLHFTLSTFNHHHFHTDCSIFIKNKKCWKKIMMKMFFSIKKIKTAHKCLLQLWLNWLMIMLQNTKKHVKWYTPLWTQRCHLFCYWITNDKLWNSNKRWKYEHNHEWYLLVCIWTTVAGVRIMIVTANNTKPRFVTGKSYVVN